MADMSPRGFIRWVTRQWQLIDEQYREDAKRAQSARAATERAPDDPEPGKGKSKKRRGKQSTRDAKTTVDASAGNSGDAPIAARKYDWTVLIVLVVVAVSLTLQEYFGQRSTYKDYFPYHQKDEYWQLGAFVWWSGWRVFGYVVIPVLVLLFMRGERLRDYYISPRGFFKHLWIYVVLFLMVLPGVIYAAQTQSFARTYPFYKLANRSTLDLWTWEGLYAVQFMALEFFFRGFILHALGRYMGHKAIFVMIVPYCMIHYGKPLPETLGAIGAGIILGTLAMRTRSIWGGVIIHISVAWTMDLLALGHCPPGETGLPCKGH